MQVALHLGVHKTASTYIQQILQASRDPLREAEVGYVDLEEMRAVITPRVRRPLLNLRGAVRRTVKLNGDCRRLIMSDENIAGLGGDPVIAGRFYPMIRQRTARLVRALGGNDVELFLAVRSYDSFASSAYCEFIRYHRYLTPDEFISAVDVERLNWRDLISGLVELVGAERITIWRFEDFSKVEGQVLSALSAAAIDWIKPEGVVRPSFSQKAIEEIARLRPTVGRMEMRSLVEEVGERFPKSPDNPAFRFFDDMESSRLQRRYDDDLAQLERDFPEVSLLRP